MKRFFLALVLSSFIISCEHVQPLVDAYADSQSDGTEPTQSEIVSGLKEALVVGITHAATDASKENGFYNNSLIKIPLPEEVEKVDKTVRDLGMGQLMDDFELSLNRAAEAASAEAVDIFVESIKQMTFQDAVGIWKGESDAATQYLKRTTQKQLNSAFKPIASEAIEKVEVTKYWDDVANIYNSVPFVTKVNPDLDQYVTDKAIDGLFVLVAEEEKKIREDPVARVSDILVKVFGYLDLEQ